MGVSMRIIAIIGTLYLIIINIAGFAAMGIDKRRAKKSQWRVKEKTLFLLAVIGGSAGAIFGMQYFRHKTKHSGFVFGMPAILVVQISLAVFLYFIHIG
jgi:uncharacterized membrane protein YsdA (DUF1294 family)